MKRFVIGINERGVGAICDLQKKVYAPMNLNTAVGFMALFPENPIGQMGTLPMELGDWNVEQNAVEWPKDKLYGFTHEKSFGDWMKSERV